jgi:hypothetical protein
MFSEPTINSVSNLFSAPGFELELLGAGVLAVGVALYFARVTWIALSYARRMEASSQQVVMNTPHPELAYSGPYCAG